MSFALWPVVEKKSERTILRNVDSYDYYCMFKRVWGKSKLPTLTWYKKALLELELPNSFINDTHLDSLECEFQRLVMSFQDTKVRASGFQPIGLVGLVRVWERIFIHDEEVLAICTSLAPEETLKLETEGPLDPPQTESAATRGDNKSS